MYNSKNLFVLILLFLLNIVFCINNDSKSKLSVDNAIKIINSIYLIKPDTVCIYENHKTKLIAAIGNFDNNVIGEQS